MKFWTSGEIKRLREMAANGMSSRAMAAMLDRSPDSVIAKVVRLRIPVTGKYAPGHGPAPAWMKSAQEDFKLANEQAIKSLRAHCRMLGIDPDAKRAPAHLGAVPLVNNSNKFAPALSRDDFYDTLSLSTCEGDLQEEADSHA